MLITCLIYYILGTRLHQQARKNIQKRKPALMTAIRKYNSYCESLRSYQLPTPNFPLPTPLPTDLTELRSDESLMIDVWTEPNPSSAQAWLIDPTVREGIKYIHQQERCIEERRRLGREAENLLRYYSQELRVLEIAQRTVSGKVIILIVMHIFTF